MPFFKGDFRQLKDRVQASYKELDPFRENRLEALRSFVGSNYGEKQSDGSPETIVNPLELLVDIYLQQLVSADPQALVTTRKFALRTSAAYFGMALNYAIRRMGLRASLQLMVLESLFSMGVVKIGVSSFEDSERYAQGSDRYLPFCDPVFFDDFVYDKSVQRWPQIAFCGNRYRMDREDIENDPRNDPRAVSEMGEGRQRWDGGFGASADELSDSGQSAYDEDPREQQHELWDIWIPRQGLLVTYCENGNDRPLRVTRWEGPSNGPFPPPLMYATVLNNIQPVAPVGNKVALADLLNRLWNKMGEQASRQKTVTAVGPSNTQDGTNVRNANDGEIITVNDPKSIAEMRYGGVEQATLAFAASSRETLNYYSGNPEVLGGLATGAPTATQEKLLSGASNARMRAMQQKVIDATRQIITDIGWHLWNDPLVRMNLTSKVAGTETEIETSWPYQQDVLGREVDMRQGQYNDLNFEIDPFSMQDQSPGEKAMLLRQIFQQDIAPMMPILAQQGLRVNLQAYLKTLAKYTNLPELEEVVELGVEQTEPPPANMGGGMKPPVTTRQYDRVSSGGGPTSGGLNRQLAMMGAGQKSGNGGGY